MDPTTENAEDFENIGEVIPRAINLIGTITVELAEISANLFWSRARFSFLGGQSTS
jgi:hypothetical protein